METHKVTVNGTEYTLYKNYQNLERLRLKFNAMTTNFWGFDFENFYQSTFWDSSCMLYTLFLEDEIVAHTTVSLFKTNWNSKQLLWAQIGTVMTEQRFQKRGLARFLMQYIQGEFKHQVDGMFLFANDTVTEFYPKFGFIPVDEYQASLSGVFANTGQIVQQLNLDCSSDLELFENYVEQSIPTAALHINNKGLAFFYTYAYPEFGYKQVIYFLEQLKTVAVAEIKENTLTIVQLYQLEISPLEDVIHALAHTPVTNVRFGFTPLGLKTTFERYKEDDLTLFVSENLAEVFEQQKLMIPMLSHT
ncbi:GNAT family N-acetyltransferase [Flavobacterium sp. JP2137]|uniref:GNAT family N-acetyltransferase n=1 Tax=Flavobacterium sp. JP2137 TaxID=3414510 RepID=UPI003D2FE2EE